MPHELNPNIQFRNLIGDLSDVIDEAILNMLDSSHPDDRVLVSLAEARGGIVRMEHAVKVVRISIANDQERVYADEVKPHGLEKYIDKPQQLPAVQKQPKPKDKSIQRPGISKHLRGALDFDCPTCHAEKHTACFYMSGPGHKSKITDQRRPDGWMHKSRQSVASKYNNNVRAKYDKEHYENG